MEASAHCASRALLPVLILMNPRTSMCGRRPDSAAIATLWCSGARCVSSASHNPGHIIIINRWRIEEASYSGMYSGFSIRHKFSALRYSRKCAWTVPQLPRVAKNFSRASFQNSFKPLFHNCFHTTTVLHQAPADPRATWRARLLRHPPRRSTPGFDCA